MSHSGLTIASVTPDTHATALKLEKLASQRATKSEVDETSRKFEAMVLENLVKSMLPSQSEEIFGKGVAGDMWKGMMAEQLGDAIAKGGGIGIADALVKAQKASLPEA